MFEFGQIDYDQVLNVLINIEQCKKQKRKPADQHRIDDSDDIQFTPDQLDIDDAYQYQNQNRGDIR